MLEPIPFAGYMELDEMNKPVAWIDDKGDLIPKEDLQWFKDEGYTHIPLYTHPAKELHLSLQKEKETGELLAVTYTDDEHRIVEVLWQRPPVKELTDDEIEEFAYAFQLWQLHNPDKALEGIMGFARAILKKARE